jgi:hypothetical protein
MSDDMFFTGEHDYSSTGIEFIAYIGQDRIVNRITREALQDFFRSPSRPESYSATYECHREEIVRLARFRIEQQERNEWGGADITSEYLREIQYEAPDGCRSSKFDPSLGFRGVAERIGSIMCPLHFRHTSVDGVTDDLVTYRGCCVGVLDTVEQYLSGTRPANTRRP